LEIAIAISVIGLVSGFFITKMITTNKAMRVRTTQNNIETVTMVLAAFVAGHNRLPRPSFDDRGSESPESEMNPSNFVGKIPFRTLGIPSKATMDGNGKPLIYAVEQGLTFNFNSIYEKTLDNYCFCRGIYDPSIVIRDIENPLPDVIAFVIDTRDNPPTISERINFTVSQYTHWISRDRLLMQYLKNCPCEMEKRQEIDF
jgi:hypothetical protein